MAQELPEGTVTVLFTDVEGSTDLATRRGDEAAQEMLRAQRQLVRRVGLTERVVFAGGGALNACLRRLLSQKIGLELTVPEQPQVVGALGAALLASGL